MKNKASLIVFGSLFALALVAFGGTKPAHAADCTVTSFYASPNAVASGQSATLNWTSYGCTYVTISGGTLNSNQYLAANSSIITGTLYGTTTYALYAYGNGISTSKTLSVYVNGGPYSYTYQCSDGVDNDGNGLIDYPNDPGCTSQYDNDESSGMYGVTSLAATTMQATNIGSTTARLNGLMTNAPAPYVAYFEYGTDYTALDKKTQFQNNSPTTTHSYYDSISVSPNTTYYFRAVGQVGNVIVRGSIQSFTTPSSSDVQVVYVGGNSSDTTSTSTVSSKTTPTTVVLSITNKSDKVNVGETIEDTVTYTNNTNKTLTNAVVSVVLPQGFTLKQTTQGTILNPTTVTAKIGTIGAGQTGSIFVEAVVGPNTALNETLVTNGTLEYTLPGGTRDSVVGYVINHAGQMNVFAGFTLGSGFFPTTIFGWFFTVIIILIIILIARRIAKAKHAHHGGHGGAHGGHGGGH